MRNITIDQTAEGFALTMNGKPLRTPLGKAMVLPNRKLAEAIAAEWQAQGEKINKREMRLTQLACVAKDVATVKCNVMLEDILPYGETDLLCYRAGNMPELLALQKDFEPIMAWAEKTYGIKLHITDGIMPVKQDADISEKILKAVKNYDEWQVSVFATVVKPLSSIILALALTEGKIDAAEAFRLAHLEETYQTEKWGADEEKEQKIAEKKKEIEAAGEFLRLLE